MEELYQNGEMTGEAAYEAARETAAPEEEPNRDFADTAEFTAGEDAEEGCTEAEWKAWEEFETAYPEITAENIPEDVFLLMAQGETPVQAMRQVEIASLKAEVTALKEKLAAAETAHRNRARTPGSMLGRAAAPEDAFLAGLGM